MAHPEKEEGLAMLVHLSRETFIWTESGDGNNPLKPEGGILMKTIHRNPKRVDTNSKMAACRHKGAVISRSEGVASRRAKTAT